MMKYILYILFIASFHEDLNGQISIVDSLKQLLEKAPTDTNRVNLLLRISNSYYFYKPDTSIIYSKMALELSRELDFTNGIIKALKEVGEASRLLGDYPGSLKMQMEALELSRKIKYPLGQSMSFGFIGITYNEMKEYHIGLRYLLLANSIFQKLPVNPNGIFIQANIGITYTKLKKPDSALYYLRLAYDKLNYIPHPQLKSLIILNIGNVYTDIGNKDSALYYYQWSLQHSRMSNESINMSRVQLKIAELYESDRRYDSSLFYARNAFKDATRTSQKVHILESSSLLVKLYRQAKRLDSAFYYEDIASATKENLYGPEKFKQLQLLMLEEQELQQKIEQEQERYKNKTRMIALWFTVGVFLIIAFILFRNNRQKQKANKILETTLVNLKSAQSQLIQSEKMASLGELTAGIAHEIQNPLNFVNNFSEVNKELADELKTELATGNLQQAKEIADDIKDNSEKINHHGKKADAIVKGMLQHSRSSSGQKEPTDINALCVEYLRLSYHGLRAKDKSFNATTKTDFDESIGSVNIVPQDIGRVVLNLINNAFYAVDEKVKNETSNVKNDLSHVSPFTSHYEPLVTVSTKSFGNKIEISVKDNGNGIPKKVLEKIFQPFFTTKPTGQGTGLGLSLSYDIVKAHGGEIKVETKEGEGTAFIISLPY